MNEDADFPHRVCSIALFLRTPAWQKLKMLARRVTEKALFLTVSLAASSTGRYDTATHLHWNPQLLGMQCAVSAENDVCIELSSRRLVC